MNNTVNANVTIRMKNNLTAESIKLNIKRYWQLYLLLIPPTILIIIFNYIPMFGLQIAFKDFDPTAGFYGGEWVGFANFKSFFSTYAFKEIIWNTLSLSIYSLIAGFPIPILLAVSMNEVSSSKFRKATQMVTFAPHFISIVVLIAIVGQILSPHVGIVNNLIMQLGFEPVNFMGNPHYFRSIYVWSGIWQTTGYASVVYIAALSAIDPQLYEAAKVDGASKLKKIWYIDLPNLMPTAVVILILNTGRLMSVGFEKVYLMQNGMNAATSEIISTYVYKVGLLNADFSFSTAVGLFNSLINLFLIVMVNQVARKIGDSSLW